MMNNIMIDLETLGNTSNSVICAIGAVEFNIETGETGRGFYKVIDIQSCLDKGLKVNGSTIQWWLTQTEAARHEIAKGGTVLKTALLALSSPHVFNWENSKVWGNGSSFDLGILADAYNACGLEAPWKHWNERDVRTLVAFAPEIKKNAPFLGVAHNALADCHHQIKYCTEIYQQLASTLTTHQDAE